MSEPKLNIKEETSAKKTRSPPKKAKVPLFEITPAFSYSRSSIEYTKPSHRSMYFSGAILYGHEIQIAHISTHSHSYSKVRCCCRSETK